jgi:hypothetical protein
MDADTLDSEKAVFRESLKGSVMSKAVYASQASGARYFRMHMTGRISGLKLAEWAQAAGVDISPFVEFARLEDKL